MSVPNAARFAEELRDTLGQISRISRDICDLYAQLEEATHSLPSRGAEKVAAGGNSTPTESVVLQFEAHRRALRDARRKVTHTLPYWREIRRDLELAFSRIEETTVEDPSIWDRKTLLEIERRYWQKRRKEAAHGA